MLEVCSIWGIFLFGKEGGQTKAPQFATCFFLYFVLLAMVKIQLLLLRQIISSQKMQFKKIVLAFPSLSEKYRGK